MILIWVWHNHINDYCPPFVNKIAVMAEFNPILKYIEQFSSDPSKALHDIERETYLKTLAPQMISGKIQGRFLSMISHMVRPRRVLEIGAFTGYGAICLAEGLVSDGMVFTIEGNRELEKTIRRNIDQTNLADQITLLIGQGEKLISEIDEQFDLVFIDAAKKDYALFYDLVFDKVVSGGFILADNVLWAGKVMQENVDRETQLIHSFNEKVYRDDRVENLIIPLIDGMMICRKK